MVLTTLQVRPCTAAQHTKRESLLFGCIWLGLMTFCLPLLTGCGPGGNAEDASALARGWHHNRRTTSTSQKVNLNPSTLAFSATEGGTNPDSQTVSISNTYWQTLDWTVNTAASWLSLSPVSGTTPSSFTASPNIMGLAAGTYSTTVTVTIVGSTSQPQSIPVTLTIAPVVLSAPTISLSPTSLAFSAMDGGSDPASQTVTVSNSGTGVLDWTVNTTAAWLSLTPNSGTAPSSFTATANLAGLAAGTYTTNLTVIGSGATNTPQSIPVLLTVAASTSLTTTTTTASTVSLTWNPESDPSVTGYFVHYGTHSPNLSGSCAYSDSTFFPLSSFSNPTSPSVTIGDLTTGTIYYFAVSAYNGYESACSNEVSKGT